MVKINVICVGKIKKGYLKDAIDDYSKRLSKYCKLEIIEVGDEKCEETLSPTEEDIVRKKEAEKILKYIKPDTFTFTLEIKGKQLTSEELSDKIGEICLKGTSEINFVIGGSIGLHNVVSAVSNYKLSFSKMTFPHQLMRIVLLEQIYRGFKIAKNEPYHK